MMRSKRESPKKQKRAYRKSEQSMIRGMDRNWLNGRIKAVMILFVVALAMLGARLAQLQVLQYEEASRLVTKTAERTKIIKPFRGNIFGSSGELLATTLTTMGVEIHPKQIRRPDFVVDRLSEILGLRRERAAKSLRSKSIAWLTRSVTPAEEEAIRELREPGVYLRPYRKRFYPQKSLAGQVIGFVDADNIGQGGVERVMNDALSGRAGRAVVCRHPHKNDRPDEVRFLKEVRHGHDLVLAIDVPLQYMAEEELARACIEQDADHGVLVALEPKTGAVRSMAVYPPYNPNDRNAEMKRRYNRALIDASEPGSVFKIFIIAVALESGTVQLSEKVDCENGSWRFRRKRYTDVHPYGLLEPAEIIIKSSNIGTCKLARRLEPDLLYSGLKEFGFGAATGVLSGDETAGRLLPPKSWDVYTMNSVAMGYGGVLSSPVQIAGATSVMAASGVYMQPYLIEEIRNGAGSAIERTKPKGRRIISAGTAKAVLGMMEQVVRRGTGRRAQVPGFRIAGKTGTAKRIDPVTGRYSDREVVAGFTGVGPVDNPLLTVYVLIDNPKKDPWGGSACGPVAGRFLTRAFEYLGVAPASEEAVLIAGKR